MSADPAPSPPRFHRYVALGDSTTEGMGDPYPDGRSLRGWADRFADQLAAVNPGLTYANLAIRGRKLPQIRAEQLEPALAMEPDLASILGGVNDVLRPRVDLAARMEDLETIVAALRGGGATVLMMTAPEFAFGSSSATSRLSRRMKACSALIREIAGRQGAIVIDLEGDGIRHQALWAPDRLHASPYGHERMAALAADALGITPIDEDWEATLPELRRRSRPARIATNGIWAGRHLAPWVLRRIRGVSSGDGRDPKRPALEPVLAPE